MKRTLITGAGGFIGRYVTEELRAAGHETLAFKGDIFNADFNACMKETRPEYLINLAWVTGEGYLTSRKNLLFLQKGIEAYEAFYANGGRRALYVGTEQEYKRTGTPFSEDSPLEPSSIYARCKASLGSVLTEDARVNGLGFVWGRVFFVYGAGEKPARLMPSLINGLAAGEAVTCSCGDFVRDYIYVKDLARAIRVCLESDYSGAVNFSGGADTTIREIAEAARKEIGRGEVRFKSKEECAGQPDYIRGDTSLLESLGWRREYSLTRGLREEIAALTGL